MWAEIGPAGSADVIDPAMLGPWLTVVPGRAAIEHAVLSDGWRRIRLDVERGSLARDQPILLRYLIEGQASVEPKIVPLRRLVHFCRHRRFAPSLYPRDRRIERWLSALRVGDALIAGASHKEIARVLFGKQRVDEEWETRSDSLRSRVRRLVNDARFMARGGFRGLLGPASPR